jgi:5'-nucleotidase (lipoprotein e(P4) family)
MKKLVYIFFLPAVCLGCSSARQTAGPSAAAPAGAITTEGKLWASLYQQRAAEYKALCLQAYNIARLRVDQAVQQPAGRPMAIITDIDETVLDNSPYAVHQALLQKDYDDKTWAEWTSRSEADTLAGAPSFFNYAASRKIEVFYITNRDEKERAGTLKNLQRYGFPYADDAHLILKQTQAGSSKESRRQTVAQTHDIVLLLGDNLADFSTLFDKKDQREREQNTLASAADFGKKFIVLPNPVYGDWEGAVYRYNYRLTAAQKDSVIRTMLKNY